MGKWQVNKAGNPEIKPAGVQYFFRKYDMEQGLDDPYILRIRQNKNGEILFGTSGNGAGIFDGEKFTFFNVSNGLKSNIVQDVCEDSQGNLWFATSGGGVSKYDGKVFTNYTMKNGLPDNSVWAVYHDSKGNLWFGGESGGICRFDGKTFKTWTNKDGIYIQYIREIFEDSKGNLWFGSDHMGFTVYDGKRFKNYNTENSLPNNHVLGICEDKAGKIWLATYGGGLCLFENGKFKQYGKKDGLGSLNLCDVICDKAGDLWIATSGSGMYRFDGKRFTPYGVSEGLSNNVVLSLLEDRYGNIWAGTYGGGIAEYTAKQFTYYSETEGLPGNIVRAILQNPDSGFVFTTSGAGFSLYNGKEFKNYLNGQQIPSLFVLCAVKGNDGKLWLGTSGAGICRFDGTNFNTLTTQQGLRSDYILSLICGSGGEIYVGAYGGGLSVLKENKIIHYGPKDSLPSVYINSLAQDVNKKIWIGTEAGLFLLDEGKIIKLFPEVFNNNFPVTTVHCDKSGNIWVGTDGGGLYLINNNSLESFSEKNGLCNNHVKSIITDSRNGVWIGTSNGIAYLNPRKTGKNKKYSITNYGRPEGYTGSACMNNSVFIDNKNKVWIGTGRKLLCIDPSREKINFLPPVVKIEKLNLFFENIDWQKYSDSGIVKLDHLEAWTGIPQDLVLPYNQNHLTFTFKGINLNCPEKTTYKFMLEGLDQHWNPLTSENRAIYSNIAPGKYIFKVIAVNENGIPSENQAELRFEITPPWWKQTWFRILALITLIVSIILIIKLREKKLIRDKRKLEATVKERTAEVIKQRDEILSKNEILNQQKEEISAQRDEIETQMEEIATQRDLVVAQKQQIEIIHSELTDSIHYARRIQNAILPKMEIIQKSGIEHFVLFCPRNIVSGDFYWTAHVDQKLVFCVADCTGHGVPGAFMSMLGISFLNEIVKKEKIVDASRILNNLREHIIASLQQHGVTGEAKDGMDISLCILNTENLKLQFAGANNPIYIVRKFIKSENGKAESEKLNETNFDALQTSELYELKGDKMPIAIYERMDSFTNKEIQLNKEDTVYLFSDGFADQFGGESGKKFKYSSLKKLFLSVSSLPLEEQKKNIHSTLLKWMEHEEQVDDITVLGVKI